MSYGLEVSRTALKGLAAIPEKTRGRLAEAISGLAANPRPAASRQLQGEPRGFRRLRVGDYRVLYQVDEDEQSVVVVRVGPRGSVHQ